MSFTIFRELKPEDFDPWENLKVDKKKGVVWVLVDFLLFNKDVLISAAYEIQRFADVAIDSDGERYAVVQLTKRDFDGTLRELGREFNNRLVNFAHYLASLKYTKEIKENVMQEVYSQVSDEEAGESEEGEVCEPEEAPLDVPSASGNDIDAQGLPYSQFEGEEDEGQESEEPHGEMIDEEMEDDLEDFDVDEIVVPWEEKFKQELKDKNDLYLKTEEDKVVEKVVEKSENKESKDGNKEALEKKDYKKSNKAENVNKNNVEDMNEEGHKQKRQKKNK